MESSLSLDHEDIDQTYSNIPVKYGAPDADATPKDDSESDRESCQSSGDSGSLLKEVSWVDVVKRKNFRKTLVTSRVNGEFIVPQVQSASTSTVNTKRRCFVGSLHE